MVNAVPLGSGSLNCILFDNMNKIDRNVTAECSVAGYTNCLPVKLSRFFFGEMHRSVTETTSDQMMLVIL